MGPRSWAITPGALATLSGSVLLLLVAGGAAYLDHNEALRASDWSLHALQVREQAKRVLQLLTDAETGQRGYLLTGDEGYLEPYHHAVQQLPHDVARLRELTADDATQQARLLELEPIVSRKLAELDTTLKMRRTRGHDAARVLVETDAGRQMMEAARAVIGDVELKEGVSLRTRLDQRAMRTQRAGMLIIGGALGSLVLGALAFVLVESTGRRRLRAERALRESEERLRVTMRSIGDAVVATDARGRVTFMNRVAEEMTGWTTAEASGVALEEVFRIVDERTRAKVESPVGKVLRSGSAVGLVNHTVLVGRSGREVPIDDSGAPIRYDDGTVMGIVVVFRDVTERKQADEARERLLRAEVSRMQAEEALVERERLRAAAESANVEKDRFLALLSHELRSPLNAMMGWTTVLKRGATVEQTTRAVATIERNINLQAQLVNDLLDVSRIVSGKLGIDREPTALAPLLQACVDGMRPAAVAKRIALELRTEGLSGIVVGDAKRLGQAVSNLLGNAVKFTPPDGRIDVALQEVGGEAQITVTDSGEGIRPEFLPHVFDRFRQADSSTTRVHGGLGLGLYIVKRMVDMHDGTVAAESDGPGHGARFTIRLPLRPVTPSPAAQPEDGAPGSTTLAGTRVLVVEDDGDTREALRLALEASGATVDAAESGEAARRVLRDSTPDVIVSDIGMPGESGYDLVRAVHAANDDIPAIALTGFASAEDQQQAAEVGFIAHLSKPVMPDVLVTTIRDVLRRA